VNGTRILRYGKARTALLIALATSFVIGIAALASSPSPFSSPKSTPSASASASAKASESPESSPSSSTRAAAPNASPGSGDEHGDCVSAAARDKADADANSKEPSSGPGHKKDNHGEDVSDAAHSCAKDGNDNQDSSDKASPEPSETPEAPDSPEPSDSPGD
jgi:hypothetical protein